PRPRQQPPYLAQPLAPGDTFLTNTPGMANHWGMRSTVDPHLYPISVPRSRVSVLSVGEGIPPPGLGGQFAVSTYMVECAIIGRSGNRGSHPTAPSVTDAVMVTAPHRDRSSPRRQSQF